MATRRCPRCNLINPGTAAVCDCGWSFVDQTMTEPPREAAGDEVDDQRQRDSRATGQLAVGALFLVIGIVITAATYGNASVEGGTYLIAYGPIIFGIVTIIRALARTSA